MMVNFVLGGTPTEEQLLTADMNQDDILNILDVIQLVSEILGTSFTQSVNWLEENYPQLKTKERLSVETDIMEKSKQGHTADVVIRTVPKIPERRPPKRRRPHRKGSPEAKAREGGPPTRRPPARPGAGESGKEPPSRPPPKPH